MGNSGYPIIITGMHRSGTTLLSDLLEKAGLFIGHEKENNYEAMLFLDLDDWILEKAKSTWDDPSNYELLDNTLKDEISETLKARLSGPERVEYLGQELANTYNDISCLDIPWGWKQPRATITADIWRRVFPEAKVLHILRNPLDVAQSLKKRQEKTHKRRYRIAAKKILSLGLTSETYSSSKLLDINNGIVLWEEYMKRAMMLDSIFGSRVMHIRYEDFLESPKEMFSDVLDFAGLSPNEDVSSIISHVDPSRKYAFMQNQDLKEIYNRIADREMVRQFNYDKINSNH